MSHHIRPIISGSLCKLWRLSFSLARSDTTFMWELCYHQSSIHYIILYVQSTCLLTRSQPRSHGSESWAPSKQEELQRLPHHPTSPGGQTAGPQARQCAPAQTPNQKMPIFGIFSSGLKRSYLELILRLWSPIQQQCQAILQITALTLFSYNER